MFLCHAWLIKHATMPPLTNVFKGLDSPKQQKDSFSPSSAAAAAAGGVWLFISQDLTYLFVRCLPAPPLPLRHSEDFNLQHRNHREIIMQPMCFPEKQSLLLWLLICGAQSFLWNYFSSLKLAPIKTLTLRPRGCFFFVVFFLFVFYPQFIIPYWWKDKTMLMFLSTINQVGGVISGGHAPWSLAWQQTLLKTQKQT